MSMQELVKGGQRWLWFSKVVKCGQQWSVVAKGCKEWFKVDQEWLCLIYCSQGWAKLLSSSRLLICLVLLQWSNLMFKC